MLIARRVLNCWGTTVNPGDVVPSPEKWDRLALQSHINIGWIEEVADESPQHEDREKAPELQITEAGAFSCSECERVFESEKGLKIHVARHHHR